MSSIAARSQLALRLSFFFGASGHPSVCRCNVRFGSLADIETRPRLLYPRKRTRFSSIVMSALCQKSGSHLIRSVELMVQPDAGDVRFQVKTVRKDLRVIEAHFASRANPSHCRSHLDTLTS
jgi:hypothetical protein